VLGNVRACRVRVLAGAYARARARVCVCDVLAVCLRALQDVKVWGPAAAAFAPANHTQPEARGVPGFGGTDKLGGGSGGVPPADA
jgi:hypothetical protein